MLICRFLPKLRVGACYLSQDILTLGPSRWSVCSFDQMTSPSGHSRSYEVTFVFASNFWKNRDRALGMILKCLSCTDASTDSNMTYLAPHGTSRDLDLRSNSDIDLLRSKCTYFDASWREEHDTAKIMSLAFSVQKLFCIFFAKKWYFVLYWPL